MVTTSSSTALAASPHRPAPSTSCPALNDPGCQHTRATDYGNRGCRCIPARQAYRSKRKTAHLRGQQLVPAIGTRRRIQALMAIGWSQPELSVRLGRGATGSLGPLLWSNQTRVTRDLARLTARVYDQLADTPATGPRANLVRNRARRRGWLPPLWWDDDTIDDPTYKPRTRDRRRKTDVDPIAVDQAVAGRISANKLTRAERILAVTALDEQHLTLREIALQLGIAPRQVSRDLADARQQAA